MVRKEKVLLAFKNSPFHLPVFTFLFLLPVILFSGCGDELKTVDADIHEKTSPAMSAKDIEVVFSDSGRIQVKLYSPLINRYSGKDPYMEFPNGFRVFIYDTAMRVESTITGNWGKRRESTRIMEAKGNVVVRNEVTKKQLNTEALTWDENKRMIYSNVKVKITTSDKVLFVEGLESNESFTWYKFTRVTGEMLVKKDSL
jgi:LPS export ABC transporter protein LptC